MNKVNRFSYAIPSALIVLVVSLFNACSYVNKPERKIAGKLTGTWKLDSILEHDGKYHKVDSNAIDVLVFDKESFERNTWKGDNKTIDSGKYTVVVIPQRALASVSLIPNLKIKGNDTTRNYTNFDIIKLTDSVMYKVDATELRDPEEEGKPMIVFNKHSVYRKQPVKVIK